MSNFKTGDKVLIDGNLVAEIHTYDEKADRIVYVVRQGGGENRMYGHISNTRVAHLVSGPVGASEPVAEPAGTDVEYGDFTHDVDDDEEIGEVDV